jgi:hypothetical protein
MGGGGEGGAEEMREGRGEGKGRGDGAAGGEGEDREGEGDGCMADVGVGFWEPGLGRSGIFTLGAGVDLVGVVAFGGEETAMSVGLGLPEEPEIIKRKSRRMPAIAPVRARSDNFSFNDSGRIARIFRRVFVHQTCTFRQ